ncbi:MAG: hypothetical protein KDC34_03670 [Saprospiraceae bacterium]|nr:hypothetical protein [Saprospiraceae bacterium]
MALFNIFRAKKPQKYNYVPRYYDPAKEDLESRLRQLEGSKKDDIAEVRNRLEGGFMRKSGGYVPDANRIRAGSSKRTNFRLILVLGVLLLLAYYFLSVYLPDIVKALE